MTVLKNEGIIFFLLNTDALHALGYLSLIRVHTNVYFGEELTKTKRKHCIAVLNVTFFAQFYEQAS